MTSGFYSGQTVWITGASSGIGEALAIEFAREGAHVILSARRQAELEAVADRCHEAAGGDDRTTVLVLDVTDEASLPERVEAARAATGRIDMLINNAGISQRSLAIETDMATYRTLFEVDVFGQIALTKAVLPVMIEQQSGHIAVTASVAGKIGVSYRTGYCAAKHAVMGFFDALRPEVKPDGIRVTTITPGYINTPIAEQALKGDGSRFARKDKAIASGMNVTECARVIMRGFRNGKLEIPVGNPPEMRALWLKRLVPGLVFRVINKSYRPPK